MPPKLLKKKNFLSKNSPLNSNKRIKENPTTNPVTRSVKSNVNSKNLENQKTIEKEENTKTVKELNLIDNEEIDEELKEIHKLNEFKNNLKKYNIKEEMFDLRKYPTLDIPSKIIPNNEKFQLNHLDLIGKLYTNLIELLNEKKLIELPSLYIVNKNLLSINNLQTSRFNQDFFLYYFSEYRKLKYNEILNYFNTNIKKIKITGLQASGKSHFLADFVLRNRINDIKYKSKFRFLYINDSEYLRMSSLKCIGNELKTMLCFDAIQSSDNKMTSIIKLPPKDYDTFNYIAKWLFYLDCCDSLDDEIPLINFILMIREYFNEKEIKLILVWDQINIIDSINEKDIRDFFKKFCSNKLFDNIIISSSNNNKTINDNNPDYEVIDIDPLQSFSHQELSKLIYEELKIFNLSSNKNKIYDLNTEIEHVYKICNLIEFSLSEYCCFKNEYGFEKYFINKNHNDEYILLRKDMVFQSETKFQKEYLNDQVDVISYYKNIRKILTYQEYEILKNEYNNSKYEDAQEKIDSFKFDKQPKLYNKQLIYYSHKEKTLLCQSNLIKKQLFMVIEVFNKGLSPWRRFDTVLPHSGEIFEIIVQNHYLNQIRNITFEKILIDKPEGIFCYDCTDIILTIQNCMKEEKSIMFHFLQKNHFAFDSMIYDGKSKSLILIQITINENHENHYKELFSYLENCEYQLTHSTKLKYHKFFQRIKEMSIAKTIIFQWMTDKIYLKLKKSAESFNNDAKLFSKKNKIDFLISPYHEGLLNNINSA